MAQNTADVAVGANGNLYVAALGTSSPADLYAPWPTGWKDLGLLTDDGIEFTPNERDLTDIPAWQLLDPVRRVVTSRNVQAAFTLLQYNRDTFDFAVGGGTWSQTQARQPWQATTAVTLGAYREPMASNGRVYKATVAGTTAASEPTWPTTTGATVTDGTVTWTDMGLGSTAVYRFLPNEPEVLDKRLLGWEWRDGGRVERVVLTQGIVGGGAGIVFKKDDAAKLEVTFQIEGQAGVKPYTKLDNYSAVIP
jgi:hypothetical protein